MKIDFSPQLQKFTVWVQFHEVNDARNIPNRKFDKNSNMWVAGMTRANVNYLKRWFHRFTDQAKAAADLVEKGPVIKRGVAPANFTFKTEPKPHQLEPFLRMQEYPYYALFMDPGTGKTKILIDDAVAWALRNTIDGVLVVCPNSIKSNWEEEVHKHGAGKHVCFIYDPSVKVKAGKFIRESVPGTLKWMIMAVETFSTGEGYKIATEFLALNRCAMVIDESSRIKNHSADRTKKLLELSKYAKLRRVASGTPFSKGLHQCWPQYEFLDPGILDMGYFAFRNYFCVMGGFKNKEIVGTKCSEEFIDLVTPFTFRASKAECCKDLPPKVYQIRECHPSVEQARFYNDLLTKGIVEEKDKFLSFSNALVKNLRLQQICGGFVTMKKDFDMFAPFDESEVEEFIRKAEDMEATPIPGPNPKVEELLNVLEETPGKVIIWCRFKPEIRAVAEALRKVYGKDAVVEFHGDIKNTDRTTARQRFQTDDKCLYFIGQVSTGGIGITLTAASTVIYLSNNWPLEDRIQSEDRAHRIGQVANSVQYIDLVMSPKWVDRKILKALQEGKDYTQAIMDEIEEATK